MNISKGGWGGEVYPQNFVFNLMVSLHFRTTFLAENNIFSKKK